MSRDKDDRCTEAEPDDHRILLPSDVSSPYDDVHSAIEDYLKRAGEMPNNHRLVSVTLGIEVGEPVEVESFEAEADVSAKIAGEPL